METNKNIVEYGVEQIKTLEGIEAIRLRPGMYIGSVGPDGVRHITLEIISNAVDEYLNDGNAYALVEWPERIEDILGADTLIININHLSDTEREISVGK